MKCKMAEGPLFLDSLSFFFSSEESIELTMTFEICDYGKPCFGLTLRMEMACMTPVWTGVTIGEESALNDSEEQNNKA